MAIDPLSGQVRENLGFHKTACTRLTACADSFFCRGEGTLRYDRKLKKVLVDGAQRPACNDGALPAHGLLYLGPWQCDCNLSLIGCVAKCSAGSFSFDHRATDAEHLETFIQDESANFDRAGDHIADQAENDWPTYRADNQRSSSSEVPAPTAFSHKWTFAPDLKTTPAPAVAAGGLVFTASGDGKVRAIESDSGKLKWEFATPCPIKASPTIWQGRVYFGGGDGYVYCLQAMTGRLVWRFRAAPLQRRIMVYDSLCSTWPVNTGVLMHDGVAYFAAGIIDHDGTYVYALDAKTGKIKWQNNTSGHLNAELRKGVSAQGNLSILADQLLLAGGNQVSPAIFDIHTGECRARSFDQGRPKANNGKFVGVLANQAVIVGGRVLYSAPENVSTKGGFTVFSKNRAWQFNFGGVPPAWNENTVAFVNFKHGNLTACDAPKTVARVVEGLPDQSPQARRRRASLSDALVQDKAVLWQTNLDQPNKFETISIVVCPNAVAAVVKFQHQFRAHPQWYVAVFDAKTGKPLRQQELPAEPLPEGLLLDRDGRLIVTMLDGSVVAFGNG